MPTRITEIVVDAADQALVARFWSELLGWPLTIEAPDEFSIEDEHLCIVFGPVPEPKTVKNRVHLDLASSSLAAQKETVARALELGARHIDIGQGEVPWVVLADPEGNEFCVVTPWPEYGDTGPVAAIGMDCADPVAIAPFWSAATGWPIVRQSTDVAGLHAADGRGPWLSLVRVPDPKQVKNRVHIDVAPFAGDDHVAEVERLIALGARRIDIGQGDVPWEVMADPEGNDFCVLTPRD
jgi:predicted enzyme related to lactoylglutathione lyase